MIVSDGYALHIIKFPGWRFDFLQFHLEYLQSGLSTNPANRFPAFHPSQIIRMDDEFLILFFGSFPGLSHTGVIGINIFLGDFGPEYRGGEIHHGFLGNIHHDFMVGIGEDIVLKFLADHPQLAQTVVGQKEANVGFPPQGN